MPDVTTVAHTRLQVKGTRAYRNNTETHRGGCASVSGAGLASARYRQRRRAYIESAGAVPATTPAWLSAEHWLADVQAWLHVDGPEMLAGRMRPDVFYAICAVAAGYADSASGRNMAATAAVLARRAADLLGRDKSFSGRTITTWRAILAESGWAVLARQGSGGGGRPNRVPVWHLISRPAIGVCDLPPPRRGRRSSTAMYRSPSARARGNLPIGNAEPAAKTRRRAPERPPRALRLQRMAAKLLPEASPSGSHHRRGSGLAGVHPGRICDAITASGLDWERVNIVDVCRAINEQPWWPGVRDPVAFLAARLRRVAPRLNAAAASASGGGCAATGLEDGAGGQPGASAPASPEFRAAAMASVAAVIRETKRAAATPAPAPAPEPVRPEPLDDAGDCCLCGAPDAPRRPGRARRIAALCDACAIANVPARPRQEKPIATRPYGRRYVDMAVRSSGRLA